MRKNWKQNNLNLQRFEHRLLPKKCFIFAGVDEAGRGPLAGPVVAAAVILKKKKFDLGIRDSKLLTAAHRERAFQEILSKAYIGIGIVENREIDNSNIYLATILAMKKALARLSVTPEYVLIDGIFNNIRFGYAYQSIVAGDNRCLSIACASIVAKVARDELMSHYARVYPHYGFERNRGYGTPEHLLAIKKFGVTPLHRLSFNPIRSSAKFKNYSRPIGGGECSPRKTFRNVASTSA
ncbi:MAG: ribonuclease HII [Candidatus Omnitrophota bacterium]